MSEKLPPLSLYVHLPWCVSKCPYCDFNSHAVSGPLPEAAYVDAVIRDLEIERERGESRSVNSVFFGGGTPSLFAAVSIARLLEAIHRLFVVDANAEITLEANPGSSDAARFSDYRTAGINRLSIGVQSFSDHALKALGRVHDAAEARRAIASAEAAGFTNFNVDLMYALPNQTAAGAVSDLSEALSFRPPHLSLYHLTVEPNTLFYHRTPPLPDHDAAWEMQAALLEMLSRHDYDPYEVSAHAVADHRCRHNLNYWEFGDYVGVGAGSHSKVTHPGFEVRRYLKEKRPADYINAMTSGNARRGERVLGKADLVFEFALNAMRLTGGFRPSLFRERTGLDPGVLDAPLEQAQRLGLLSVSPDRIRPTDRGRRFLDDLVQLFFAEESDDPSVLH